MIDDAFWLRYLRAHADPRTRTLHAAGTAVATTVMTAALLTRNPKLAALSLLCGYGPAWYAHAIIERNKPETFTAPLRSLASDYKMFWHILTRKIDAELQRAAAEVASPSSAKEASPSSA